MLISIQAAKSLSGAGTGALWSGHELIQKKGNSVLATQVPVWRKMEKQNWECLRGSMVSPVQVVSNSEAVSSKTNINQHSPVFSLPWSLHLNPRCQAFVATQWSNLETWSRLKLTQQNLKLRPCCSCCVALLCPSVLVCCFHLFCEAPGEQVVSALYLCSTEKSLSSPNQTY